MAAMFSTRKGGPFDEGTGSTTTQFCVIGSPFIFVIFDAAGDWLCCESDIGTYHITLNAKSFQQKSSLMVQYVP